MKRLRIPLIIALAAVAAAGCNTLSKQPELRAANIDQPVLHPGDTAVITVQAADKNNIIDRVEGVVTEEPTIKFKMRDDGVPPDEKADDDVWTLQVDVPIHAPPGDFTLEFTALRDDGIPVPVRNEAGEVVALKRSLPIVIRYEQQP